jgi:hypothetical protein
MTTLAMVDASVPAEDAPLGVQLWPTITPDGAPNFTLAEVRRVYRDWSGLVVVTWVYQSGATRVFYEGERVAVRVADASDLPASAEVHGTVEV